MNYNELYHHGVKGMKWGVRRKKKQDGERSKKTMSTAKKVAIGAAVVAAIAGGAYGAYKLNNLVKTQSFEINKKRGIHEASKLFQEKVDEIIKLNNYTEKQAFGDKAFEIAKEAGKVKSAYLKDYNQKIAAGENFVSALQNVYSYYVNGRRL